MGIENRSKDASEQKLSLHFNQNVALTGGETGVLSFVPFPCCLNVANIATFSVQGTPNIIFTLSRFIPGTGSTTWFLGSTFSPVDFGTSGVLTAGISLPVSGSTLTKFIANDIIGYQIGAGGSTSGIFGLAGCFVVTPLQDIKVYLGLV